MGDDGGKNAWEGSGDVAVALQKHLPTIIKAITDAYDPAAAAEVGIARKYSPEVAAIQAATLGKEGKDLARIGREISRDEQLEAAKTEAEIAAGAGRTQALELDKTGRQLDPEFYNTRAKTAEAIGRVLDFDPTKLSKGEEEAVSRGLGRSGNFVPSALETAKGALTFGNKINERRQMLGGLTQGAAASIPALKGPVDATAVSGRRTILPNVGTQNYTGIQQPGINTANQAGGGLMNTANAAMQINMQKELSDWDKYMKGLNATTSTIGSVAQIAGMAAGV